MLLRWKLVRLLNDCYRTQKRATPTREVFVTYALKAWFVRPLGLFIKQEHVREIVDEALGDCIEGKLSYIGYADGAETNKTLSTEYGFLYRSQLKVTREGREFITSLGLIDAFLNQHSPTIQFLIGGGAVACIWLVAHFWPLIEKGWKW